jgi:hypothetical protein
MSTIAQHAGHLSKLLSDFGVDDRHRHLSILAGATSSSVNAPWNDTLASSARSPLHPGRGNALFVVFETIFCLLGHDWGGVELVSLCLVDECVWDDRTAMT